MAFPKKIKLWAHQLEALKVVTKYFDKHVSSTARDKPAALVNIPTGGGKTAVIALLAHWHPKLSITLVVAPRTAIRDQLVRELGGVRGLFPRFKIQKSELPRKIIALKSAAGLQSLPDNSIVISTIQLINDLARTRDQNKQYDILKRRCNAVIVDEGHYEPAQTWSQAIRGLGKPIALITATPYRNDLKPFNFDSSAIHVSRYAELTDNRVLRDVEIVQESPAAARNPEAFVNSVISSFIKCYGAPPSSDRKLIIRCRKRADIEQIGERLRAHARVGENIVCLHENFKPNRQRPWELRQPPDPELERAPVVWVHQHKLLEGVDGPSFRALAFYGVVGSSRPLVQQVGRIIRNPTLDTKESALIIDHSDGYVSDMWERFVEYDREISSENFQTGIAEVSSAIEKSLPSIFYAGKQFRRRFEVSKDSIGELFESLRLPLRCHLYAATPTTNLPELARQFRSLLAEDEFPSYELEAGANECVILFEKLQTSPLLERHFYVEKELHALIAVRRGSVVALLDTSRSGVDRELLAYVGRRIPRKSLERLVKESSEVRIVDVHARNSSLAPAAIRKRSSSAASLEEIPPALDEFQFVPSSITAASRLRAREVVDVDEEDDDRFTFRSIGFGLGRVTDTSGRKSYRDWKAWIDRIIAASLDETRQSADYLARFAKVLDSPPDQTAPRNVLFDLDEARELFVTANTEDPIDIANSSVDCHVMGRGEVRQLEIEANGVRCAATFSFDTLKQRYELASDDLARLYVRSAGDRGADLVEFLNSNQSFVVIPDSAGAIYADGNFYDPRLGLGAQFDPAALGLSEMLQNVPELRTLTSEKGDRGSARAAGWARNSVFNWIDENVDSILPNADIVVCDDGQRESCDFILSGQRNGRPVVIMVHAKASRVASFVSASALHDIAAQAQKQVKILAPFGADQPPQVHMWGGPWDGPSREGRVSKRLRRVIRGQGPARTWDTLRDRISNQNTEREVVLVLGAALDKDRLFAQARRNQTPPSAVHVVHLLRSTRVAVNSVNARLKVYCG
ncbi:MAG: DEAD/DEAH box helicase family protein [Xanthobacteraceae bacterium]|nr:DEAD/DEAH box helicase family protein [Xanthobacteraceae bacterium]